ncbi:carboxypeptidase M32 [Acetobacter sp. TBRC 12305]|uniref:Metal-dependent carboxypeptidase n=1 Tax=Acetobacter garciniae TaxID=2817435 RepID=A0A939KNN2_9PROT|nr:carboxypeptidase M32 [Acetobacter garciniae]MBO1325885.1 carboxypeptidase M32 [Acetobacter garciniae]MBX0345785.1 carboxypeptidase M32 [Acetobacter garciniae]
MNTAYLSLERHFARLSSLNDAIGILSWDKEVMMPSGAAERRAENMAMLEGLRHEILTAPVMAELLAEAGVDASGDAAPEETALWRSANLAEMRRLHKRATALPQDLVEAFSHAASRCEIAWRSARENSDFPTLLPYLSEVLRLTRAVAAATGDALGLSPYDALLDGFDPGTRQSDIDPVFTRLRAELPELIGSVLERQAALPAATPLQGPFSVARQEALGRVLMRQLGFDMTRGRLDVSTHPFCGGATYDVRLTTRYDEADFIPAMMGVLHETGHALYDMGLPSAWVSQPVGQAGGMTLHESQSLLMEMQFCRSGAFARWLAPHARTAFDLPDTATGWGAENLHRLLTHVQPGFIRVDADEVTYPAHILVRYELEKALIAGDLALADLPGAFNDGIHALLGLRVPDDRRGCLQDIHWPEGLFGYFPCYALGAMAAAQFRVAACEQNPDILPAVGRGDFAPLLGWLRQNVHGRASSATMPQILRDATGKPLGADAYLAHIRHRYLDRAPDA